MKPKNFMICKKCKHIAVYRTPSGIGGSWYDKIQRKTITVETIEDIVNIRCNLSSGYSFVYKSMSETKTENLKWDELQAEDKAEIPVEHCPYVLEHAFYETEPKS